MRQKQSTLQPVTNRNPVFYCDPPYWQTKGYKADFTFDDHIRLAEKLKNICGKFLLSINDHPDIRKLYKGMHRKKVTAKYTISRNKTAAAQDRAELLISNYKLKRE